MGPGPHNQKKGSRANKNKKKNKKNGSGNNKSSKSNTSSDAPAASVASTNNSSFAGATAQLKTNPLKGLTNLPTFGGKGKKNSAAGSGGTSASSGGGYYEIYKQATTRFWTWMKKSLPESKMIAVNDLRKGVGKILQQNIASLDGDPPNPIVTPKTIMDDLTTSITYRELLTQTHYSSDSIMNKGDEGHRYMIAVLRHCRSVLRFGRIVAKVAILDSQQNKDSNKKNSEDSVQNEIGGKFNALLLDDEDEEQEDSELVEEKIRQRHFPKFTAPETPDGGEDSDYDIEQTLINGDARFQAVALFRTMEDLMGTVDGHYGMFKNHLRGQEEHGGSTIQMLAECAVAANMATENIVVAENELMTNHPYLKSFYHILSLVYLPSYIADIEKQIKPSKLESDPNMTLNFVAQIVECAFHNRGDERIPLQVKKFVKKSGLRQSIVEMEAKKINLLTSFEVQILMEERMNTQIHQFAGAAGITPHSWLEQNSYIGGDRCILNTQSIVQKLMDVLQDSTKLVGRPGFWGPTFDEQNNPARRIRGDLDELFAGSIMPELIEICRQAPFEMLPERSQLMTVLTLLHRHLKDGERTRPIPISLTFGLHAMLTSIFVLQGNNDLSRMASYSKQSYNKLFAQLDAISDPKVQPENAPTFYLNVALFKNLVHFAQPVKARYNFDLQFLDPSIAERFAFWNPLIGGDYMLYGIYICSIGLGSATVDSMGQLRFTLHLYNALKQFIPTLTVPFLDNLDKVFAKTKAVWVGGRPNKGSYAKNFSLAWGMSLAEASRLKSKSGVFMDGSDDAVRNCFQNQNSRSSNLTRELDEINPEDYSISYRRLVLHDFEDNGETAEYTIIEGTTDEVKSDEHFQSLSNLLTRINMTRDGMDDDENFVLPTNFAAVGCILLEFTNKLSKHLGWDYIIEKALVMYPDEIRKGRTMGGRPMTPGSFTSSDLNLRQQGIANCLGSLMSQFDAVSDADYDLRAKLFDTAEFLKDFFAGISKERYSFFVEKDEKIKSERFGPLEGCYPYGRTGKTMQDPLQGFTHFKRNKSGEPRVRIVKPGKRTPFHPTRDGDVETPYEERGSLMRREPSGRYRHLASYSMDELIELGWDGAMYCATDSKTAANGYYVPFVCGYDSDPDDEYEPVDLEAGKRAGVIGLPADEVGLYMAITVPIGNGEAERQIVLLNKDGRSAKYSPRESKQSGRSRRRR